MGFFFSIFAKNVFKFQNQESIHHFSKLINSVSTVFSGKINQFFYSADIIGSILVLTSHSLKIREPITHYNPLLYIALSQLTPFFNNCQLPSWDSFMENFPRKWLPQPANHHWFWPLPQLYLEEWYAYANTRSRPKVSKDPPIISEWTNLAITIETQIGDEKSGKSISCTLF